MTAIDWYRKNWPKAGILASGAAAGALALTNGRLDRSRTLSVAAAATLGAHQFEEYVWPGWFPGLLNGELMKSDQPANYPGNTQSVLIINTALGYSFMALAVLFPRSKTLGLAQKLFGFAEAAMHAVVFPAITKRRYTPGEATALLLWLPIGIAWIRDQQKNHGGFTSRQVLGALAMVVAFASGGIQGPIQLYKDKNSPFAFEDRQVQLP